MCVFNPEASSNIFEQYKLTLEARRSRGDTRKSGIGVKKMWKSVFSFFLTFQRSSVHIVTHFLLEDGTVGGVVLRTDGNIHITFITAIWLHGKTTSNFVPSLTIKVIFKIKHSLLINKVLKM